MVSGKAKWLDAGQALPVRSIRNVEDDNQSECHKHVECRLNGARYFRLIAQQISADFDICDWWNGFGSGGRRGHWSHWGCISRWRLIYHWFWRFFDNLDIHWARTFLWRLGGTALRWTARVCLCLCCVIAGRGPSITMWHLTSQQYRHTDHQ